MTSHPSTTVSAVRVAIDIAKLTHQILIELPSGRRRMLRVGNTKMEIEGFIAELQALNRPCEIAFEPTGDYHRPLSYFWDRRDFICRWCRRSRSLERAKRCTTRGTRTTRRTPK
jgi:transposase